jgi:hypothetical protein
MKSKALQLLESLSKEARKRHSKEFLKILEGYEADIAIHTITHSKPVLVFWISQDGEIIDAGDFHLENPPKGDRSVFKDSTHKGYLRGRAAYIGDVLYIVIYGEEDSNISKRQLYLIRRFYPKLIRYLIEVKKVPAEKAESVQFINERGEVIL